MVRNKTKRPFELPHPLLVINGLHDSSTAALVQPIQHHHVLLRYVKIKDLRILDYPLRIVALWQRNPVLLKAISDQYLSRRLVISLGNFDQGRIIGLLVPDQRAVCLDDDSVLLAILYDLSLLAPRMQLQ